MLAGAALVVFACSGAAQAAQQTTPQPAAEAGVLSFTPDDFAASRPNTAQEMVNRLPGFQLDTGDEVRGFAGAAGNVLIDGQRPTTKSDSLSEILSRIPASQVERIDLIRGAAPGIDMQGRTVVANVIRKKTDSFQQTVTANGQWFLGTGRVLPGAKYDANWRAGQRSLDVSLSRGISMDDSVGKARRLTRYADGRPDREERGWNEGDGWSHGARANFKTPLAGGTLSLNGSASADTFKTETHLVSVGDSLDTAGRNAGRRGEIGVNYLRPVGRGLELEVLGLQKRGEGDFRGTTARPGFGSLFSSTYENGESIGRAILRYKRSDKLDIEVASEGAFNFRETAIAYQQNGAPVTLPGADVRVEEVRGEASAKAAWRPWSVLSLEAGLRYERSTIRQSGDTDKERSFTYPKPRFQATWSPNAGNQLRFLAERKVGQLDFGDFASSTDLTTGVLTAGNAELEPDKTWYYELAYERRFWGKGALVVSVIRREISDVIDLKSFPVDTNGDGRADDLVVGVGNIGDGRADDLKINLTLPTDKLGVSGGEFTAETWFTASEVVDPTTRTPRRISGERPDAVELGFRQDLPARKLTWSVNYYAGWEEDYFRLDQREHYELRNYWQAAIEYKPSPKLTLLWQLNNIDPFKFDQTRKVYAGPRDTAPVEYAEQMVIQSQPRIFFRVRRALG